MIKHTTIQEITQRLIKTYNPQEIYLFGSYAWGQPDEDSDLDFLIIIDKFTKDHYHTLLDGHKALQDLPIAKDILVVSREDFEKKSTDRSQFLYKIKNKGKKIYAKA